MNYTGLKIEEVKADVVGGNNAQIIRIVRNMKQTIGYVSMGEVIHSIKIGEPLQLISRNANSEIMSQEDWRRMRKGVGLQ